MAIIPTVAVTIKDSKSGDSWTVTCDSFPVSIGRSTASGITLEDDAKHVSSTHAELSWSNSVVTLIDHSLNGTYFNDSQDPIGHGNTATLSDGSTIKIGDYELHIQISNYATSVTSNDRENSDDSEDPFDFVQESDKAPDSVSSPDVEPAVEPDDIFSDWGKSDSSSQKALQSDRIQHLNDEGIGPDDWKDDVGSISKAAIDIPDTEALLKVSNDNTSDTDVDDWAEWIEGAPKTTTEEVKKSREIKVATPAKASQSNDDVLHALLIGAGLEPTDFESINRAELAHHIGGILNRSTQSMILLLRSRDEIKNAMRAEVTLLASVNNSPLKFSVSVEDALTKLLTPSTESGFVESNKAIDKGLRDIKVHQLAMLEAMRSALHIALSHFDPELLEKDSREASPLASTLPLAREAKLWEQFQLRYHKLKRDTVDDFSDQFGKELRKSYEKSVSGLKEPSRSES